MRQPLLDILIEASLKLGFLEFTLCLLSFPWGLFLEFEYFELPDSVASVSDPGHPVGAQVLAVEMRKGGGEGEARGRANLVAYPSCATLLLFSSLRFYLNKGLKNFFKPSPCLTFHLEGRATIFAKVYTPPLQF